MSKAYLWTHSKARLHFIKSSQGQNYHWLFLPGGPGLGAEYLTNLTAILNLPGTIWHVDFPGDGSNRTDNDEQSFSHWSDALIEAVNAFDNVILVAHSSGGMFALATPELENKLSGLILMDSAPNASWQQSFAKYRQQNPVTEAEQLQQIYIKNPSDDSLKKLTIACAPYFSTAENIKKTLEIFNNLPFNHATFVWAAKNFDDTYEAKWVPQNIPTLILAGDQDHITPLSLFGHAQDFQRDNIKMKEISNASHFPWLDNPEEVIQLFSEFYKIISD